MFSSLKNFLSSIPLTRSSLSIIGLFVILAAIPLTVFLAQQQQEIRQKAAQEQCTQDKDCSDDLYYWDNSSPPSACIHKSGGYCWSLHRDDPGAPGDPGGNGCVYAFTTVPNSYCPGNPPSQPTATPTPTPVSRIGTCGNRTPDQTVPPSLMGIPNRERYEWQADCGFSCSTNSQCPQNNFDLGNVDPTNSSWCYGFEDGAKCLKLVRPPCRTGGPGEGCGGPVPPGNLCRDNPVVPDIPPAPLGTYKWKVLNNDCGLSNACNPGNANNDCPQNTFDPRNVKPAESNWCYGFQGGARCLQLVRVGCETPGCAGPTPTSPPGLSPTPTPPVGISPFPTPSPEDTVLEFKFKLQGIGPTPTPIHPSRSITVEVCPASQDRPCIAHAEPNAIFDNGFFKGTLNFGRGFTSGSYIIKLKLDNTLKKRVQNVTDITAGRTNVLPEVELLSGDVNNNNRLDAVDYAFIWGCYTVPTPTGGPIISGSCAPADLNDDGAVGGADLNILIFNFSHREGD